MTPCTCAVPEEHASWRGLLDSLSADIERVRTFSPNYRPERGLKTSISLALTANISCLIFYRVSHLLYVRGWKRVAKIVSCLNFLIHKVNLLPDSCVGPGCFLPHPAGVTFHGVAGHGLTVFSCALVLSDYSSGTRAPTLGNNITLGGHAVLMGPIIFGDQIKVGLAAIVERDCPSNMIIVSNAVGRIKSPRTG